jgi:hypothetical protein
MKCIIYSQGIAMDEQTIISSYNLSTLITPLNVVRVARELCALKRYEFKRNSYLKVNISLKPLRYALQLYLTIDKSKQHHHSWIMNLDKDLNDLLRMTRSIIALLTFNARQRLYVFINILSAEDNVTKIKSFKNINSKSYKTLSSWRK